MDSHSRSASPREPARPQHRPPSPPSSTQSGFDNRAYQHDESDPNHNDSFTSNGPHQNHQNGHSKEPNGDTKTLEAVNLELINLTPKNGSKKKDVEVDMNTTNPYDEYFVPVNEHRKYMRGEKLYVTADKRGEKGGCKRPLCWTLLGLVVVAIIALIVLAATGILFTNSPTPLEQYNGSVSSARAFGGISSDHDHDHDHDHSNHHHDHSDHDHHHEQEPSTLPPQRDTQTQSDEAQLPMNSDENGDTSMYVPRTLEGVLKIDNEIFTPELEDTESEQYRDFTETFSDTLKHVVFDRNTLENGDNEIIVEVIQIRNGSLVVTYRIHWIPKYNTESADLLTVSTLKTTLNNYLNDNNRMISVYHVAEEELPTTQVLDLCKINNYDCEYKCEFDDSVLDFTCICPHGKIVDMLSPKRCTPLLDDSDKINLDIKSKTEMEVPMSNFNKSTKEEATTGTVRLANEESMFDWKEPRDFTPETTTETAPDLNFSHIFGAETPKPEPEPNAEPEITPIPEPAFTPKPEDEADYVTEPEPTPEPQAEPEPEPEPEPTDEVKSEPEAAPEPTAEPKFMLPVPEPTADVNYESQPEPEPTAEPKPEPEPTTTSKTTTSETQPNAGPNYELEAIADSQSGKPMSVSTTEQESSEESLPEDISTTAPETITMFPPNEMTSVEQETSQDGLRDPFSSSNSSMSDHSSFDLESIIGFHTTAEPESNQNSESYLEIKPLENNENTNEGSEKIMTTTMRISISEPRIINEPSYEPKPEIISILKENNQLMNLTNVDTNNYTTIENDWLEADDENISTESTSRNLYEQSDSNMGNGESSEQINKTEQRSSKKFEDFAFETTTDTTKENNDDDVTFDLIKKNNENPSILTTTEPITEKAGDSLDKVTSNINNIETTTFFNNVNQINNQAEVKEISEENKTEIVALNKEEIVTDQNENASPSNYSIGNRFENTEEENKLMEILDINRTSSNVPDVTPTEKDLPDQSTDVNFDIIGMLYNKTPTIKEKDENNNKEVLPVNEVIKEPEEISTESDWLTESVTEVNYEDVMNQMEKQYTTETPAIKIDEIMGRGNIKDDFEPDYLNNMASKISKMSSQDEPLYGMSQDYDNEDSRVKRVNMDKDKPETQQEYQVSNLTSNTVFETTTIGQYIYKTLDQNNNKTTNGDSEISLGVKPAPVWEENEVKNDLSVLPKQNVSTEQDITITSTALPITTISTNTDQLNQENSTSMSDLMTQNTTQVNNLNVTIYEISNHSGNLSFVTTKPINSPSTEFVDHETEMNPFLPEVENNKSLVKKLQEGHDLEPANLNETQNENVEEHNSNADMSNIDFKQTDNNVTNKSNTLLVTSRPELEATTAPIEDDDFSFNQLFTNSHEEEFELTTETNKMLTSSPTSNKNTTIPTETNDNKEVLPISTFLLDTDDLDTTKRPSTLKENDLNPFISDDMTSNPIKANDSELLSVVPIEQESLMEKNNYNSENIQELNLISDSPKKSDRRTIDVSNLDSVINNVA